MKNRLVFLVLLLFSCNKSTGGQQYETWKLIEMTGQTVDSKKNGVEMEWQESYLLEPNGRFIKKRDRNGVLNEVYGSYETQELSDGKYLMLTHDKHNSLIGNCDSGLTEVLKYDKNRLSGNWWMCDGPGLLYERKDENTADK